MTVTATSGQELPTVAFKTDGEHLLFSVSPPETGLSAHLDVCAVLDISGSMGEAANPNGPEGINAFTKLDLAKRAAEVIARSLGAKDHLTVMAFDHTVSKVLSRHAMDAEGLKDALSAVAALQPCGSTHLWEGLHAGLHAMEVDGPQQPDYVAHHTLPVVLLLTDGQPTQSPSQGEVVELQRYMAARDAADTPRAEAKLITIGFGYDVNSKLLLDLSNTHSKGPGGDFAFVSDGTMLLTTFVNALANLQSTYGRRAVLRLAPVLPPPVIRNPILDVASKLESMFMGQAKATAQANAPPNNTTAKGPSPILEVLGDVLHAPVKGAPGAVDIFLGDMLYGQTRDVVLKLVKQGTEAAALPPLEATLTFQPLMLFPGGQRYVTATCGAPVLDVPGVTLQLHRSLAISAIRAAARRASVDLSGACALVKAAALATLDLQDRADSPLQGCAPHPIVDDLKGEVTLALASAEAWSKWGEHYTRSLLASHTAQACNNFKDPGLQAYGGEHTRRCRTALDIMCEQLPVPTPSMPHNSMQAVMAQCAPRARKACFYAASTPVAGVPVAACASAAPLTRQMFSAAFYNRSGGCFGPGGRVLMADGSSVAVEQVRRGHMLATPAGPARVTCVVTYTGAQTLRLPGSQLSITAWHPVRVRDERSSRPADADLSMHCAQGCSAEWRFPADMAAECLAKQHTGAAGDTAAAAGAVEHPGRVYNLLLERGHVVYVNGVECVTLAHGLSGPVVAHAYYGTQAVAEDLRTHPGWAAGWVDLGDASKAVERDEHTGLVVGCSGAAAAEAVAVKQPQPLVCA